LIFGSFGFLERANICKKTQKSLAKGIDLWYDAAVGKSSTESRSALQSERLLGKCPAAAGVSDANSQQMPGCLTEPHFSSTIPSASVHTQ